MSAAPQLRMHTPPRLLLLAVAGALAVLALAAPFSPALAAPAGKDTLTLLRSSDSVTLDPARAFDIESVQATTQIYEGLVRQKDTSSQIEPALAESWTISADGLSWTFHLRQGVFFHDGTPFNAQAAALSIMRQVDPGNPFHTPRMYTSRLLFENITRAEALDELTLRIILDRPTTSLLSSLAMAQAALVSPQAMARWGQELGSHPVGTGPFRFVEWNKGESVVLERNPAYWGKKARSSRLVLRAVPNEGARFREFQSGRADAMLGVTPPDLPLVDKIPGVKVLRGHGLNIAFLGMNTQRGHLRKTAVRQAVNLTLDRTLLVNLVFGYAAEPALSPIPQLIMDARDLLHPTALRSNVQKARQLLAKEGLAAGFDATLMVMDTPRAYLPEPQRMAQAIKQSLAAVGIRLRLVTVPWAGYLAQAGRGEHDFCLSGWEFESLSPHEFLRHKLSWDDLSKGTGSNVTFWRDKRFETLVTRAEAAQTEKERAQLYRQVLLLVAQEAPLVPLSHMNNIVALRPGVHGLSLQPFAADLRLTKVYKD